MGKTALALNIAQHVAVKPKKTVAVFSLEMSKEALLTRLLCAGARVDAHRFRLGYLEHASGTSAGDRGRDGGGASLHRRHRRLHLMDMHAKLRRLKAERNGRSAWWSSTTSS